MDTWVLFFAGIAVGWLIEWIIDWVFWRRNIRAFYASESELKRQVETRDSQIQELQRALAQAQAAHISPAPATAGAAPDAAPAAGGAGVSA